MWSASQRWKLNLVTSVYTYICTPVFVIYRVSFLTGAPLKVLSTRLHKKSHQKSSKCQNLLTGWQFLGGHQLKRTPYIICLNFKRRCFIHIFWKPYNSLSIFPPKELFQLYRISLDRYNWKQFGSGGKWTWTNCWAFSIDTFIKVWKILSHISNKFLHFQR